MRRTPRQGPSSKPEAVDRLTLFPEHTQAHTAAIRRQQQHVRPDQADPLRDHAHVVVSLLDSFASVVGAGREDLELRVPIVTNAVKSSAMAATYVANNQ
jgi:hypothetical protein